MLTTVLGWLSGIDSRTPNSRSAVALSARSHQEDRRPGLGQKTDLIPQQAPAYRVDIIGGLIEDDQAPGDDGAHGEGRQTGNTAGDLLRGSPRPLPRSRASISSSARLRV